MKVDRTRFKKSTSEVPPECQTLIERLKQCNHSQLLQQLANIETWTFGKCELIHWIDVLDIFDEILEKACRQVGDNRWALACDVAYSHEEQKLVLWTLHFTTLLIEHSFSRHLYNSMEHVNALLASSDMQIVMGVLNLLYMFSKRSHFFTRLSSDKRQILLPRLHYLAESWGGRENGFGLADCCKNEKPIPPSATTLHYEFYYESTEAGARSGKHPINCIHLEHIDKMLQSPAEIMRGLVQMYNIPADKTFLLFTHVRLAYQFSDYKSRLLCVQARLQALSVLVYSNALQDNAHTLLYPGLLEELVELLQLQLPYLVEIRSAALRTLTSIIHLDRNPHFPKRPGSRLLMIIDVTGASLYHGFLPVLVRTCITTLTQVKTETSTSEVFPLPLATALFSFLYHLASYETGGDALVNCGMMESLLHVINWHGNELEHITFVTRAVRVIDLITNIDMHSFQAHGGLQSFINRLNVEVSLCREEQNSELDTLMDPDLKGMEDRANSSDEGDEPCDYSVPTGKTCLPQRAAFLKSMLNFLKKALQDSAFSESIRHVMEGTLPSSLKHIISNAEYYGPSLFLLATDVVTVYVFQEPSLLSSLQDNGLTAVVLHSLLIKDVPATREVLGSLPNVFSALCLNTRGLVSFVACQPFDRLFKVLLSPIYLPAMRRRRTSDQQGDTATNLGNAMDELMRHQPSLKADATASIIKLLQELCHLGTDPKYVCHRTTANISKSEITLTPVSKLTGHTEGSSDEEDEDDEEISTSSQTQREDNSTDTESPQGNERTPIVLIDYILNIMKFVDAILSNNSTDDHCREFVNQGGLVPLLKILGLPNLPVDCPVTQASQAVASVCKTILNLAHEPKVIKQGMIQLADVLRTLEPLCSNLDKPGGSILLHELANSPNLETAFSTTASTPLLHAMNAAHGYVLMFVHVCRTGQNDIRGLSLQHWGSDDGLNVLTVLAELYTSLVWESTLLLALCSDDIIPANCDFGKEDMDKLLLAEKISEQQENNQTSADSSNGMTSAMEALRTNTPTAMDVDGDGPSTSKPKEERSPPTSHQLKYIKPLLGASSRLGRALAELFGLLVKLCVGSPIRQRRGQSLVSQPHFPGPFARSVATALNYLLASGLNWEKLPVSPIPKFRLTFLICSVGFTSPMLFDEKRYPYHLMLQKFVSLGGQATFFNTFRWALSAGGRIPIEEGLEHPDLPDGTGEFLDAWLMLLEKMVNPKAILDSPHVISKPGTVRGLYRNCLFDPVKYLVQIHKQAFKAVKLMWGKKPLPNYGGRMCESMLSILRHILRGEKIVKERLNKTDDVIETHTQPETEPTAGNATASSSNNIQILPHGDVNYSHMDQLLEMGFSLDQCREALLHTSSVEQATDYLLNNPQPRDQPMTPAVAPVARVPTEVKPPKKPKEDDCVPLAEEAIDAFTKDALQKCLQLLDLLPDTVYRACDLLVTITKREGEVYRQKLLDIILSEIGNYMLLVLGSLDKKENIRNVDEWLNGDAATKMAVRLHLYTLLFEGPVIHEMRIPCADAVLRSGLLPLLIKLLILCERIMRTAINEEIAFATPKWLTPLLLLLDLIEKVTLCTHRKEEMHKCTFRIWRWYDLLTGKWTPYSMPNNKLIDEAYWNSETSMRVTCGRKRYTISFNAMSQTNEETANSRPISMAIRVPYTRDMEIHKQLRMAPKSSSFSEIARKRNVPVEGLDEETRTRIVITCVRLMELEVDRDTLHAVMRLCLRLTREFRCARIFAEEGGVKMLLNMTQQSGYAGFSTIATLLIRHVLEEPQTLRLAMEKVIRGRTLNTIPPPHKELQYLCRHISSVVCRDPDAFVEVGKAILRVDLSELNRREEDDHRLILRCEPPTRSPAQPMDESVSVNVIYDLLNALVKRVGPLSRTESPNNHHGIMFMDPSFHTEPLPAPPRPNIRVATRPRDPDVDKPIEFETDKFKSAVASAATKLPPDEECKKPLLARHSLLKMLAEAVRSYGAVAKVITEFTYKAGQNDLITEDCTAMAYVMDHLLPLNENFPDPECSMMARMLIAAISSCNHSPEAQASLVTELKCALARALALPESQEKHVQIQLLAGVVSTMVEHCPPSQHTSVRGVKLHSIGGNITGLNNIVKIMLRKGVLADLSRITHCLDLSSPLIASTINAVLKPLETLSRIVNQPTSGTPVKYVSSKKNSAQGRANANGATSAEATNAREETVEDSENTEHDMSGTTESLEQHAEGAQEVSDVDRLEDIMDQLLERENQSNSRTYSDVTSGRNHLPMDIDEDVNEIRNIVYDTERDVTEELMSTDSGESVSNASDNEVEDDTNDDEDVEDDEMDEGDDNDDNYDEEGEFNGLGFFDNENPGLFRVTPSAEREEEVLMIQYSDPDSENESVSRMVHWTPNGLQFPLGLFEEGSSNNDNAVPASHPLLMSRHNIDVGPMSGSRTQRTNRQRRYQYLQINARNHNPPVILQRLLGPGGQNLTMGGPVMSDPPIRVTNRVVLMENGFNLFPTAEEQIDFVDQSGYLFGPSLSATLNNIPSALHWWNEEKALLDGESHADICVSVCSKLIPFVETHRDIELNERKRKHDEEKAAYESSRQKASAENMDTDRSNANQGEPRSADSPPETESPTDNTQQVAENMTESIVLDPLTGQPPGFSRSDSYIEMIDSSSMRQPQPVTLIQNGEVWEYSESPMMDEATAQELLLDRWPREPPPPEEDDDEDDQEVEQEQEQEGQADDDQDEEQEDEEEEGHEDDQEEDDDDQEEEQDEDDDEEEDEEDQGDDHELSYSPPSPLQEPEEPVPHIFLPPSPNQESSSLASAGRNPPAPYGGSAFRTLVFNLEQSPEESEATFSSHSDMAETFVRDPPVPYTQSTVDYEVEVGDPASVDEQRNAPSRYSVFDPSTFETGNEISPSQTSGSTDDSNATLPSGSPLALRYNLPNPVNQSSTYSGDVNPALEISAPSNAQGADNEVDETDMNDSFGSDNNEPDENDVINDSFRSEDSEIIEIFNNTQLMNMELPQNSDRLRPMNEQILDDDSQVPYDNRNENIMSPDIFSSEEDCNMQEDEDTRPSTPPRTAPPGQMSALRNPIRIGTRPIVVNANPIRVDSSPNSGASSSGAGISSAMSLSASNANVLTVLNPNSPIQIDSSPSSSISNAASSANSDDTIILSDLSPRSQGTRPQRPTLGHHMFRHGSPELGGCRGIPLHASPRSQYSGRAPYPARANRMLSARQVALRRHVDAAIASGNLPPPPVGSMSSNISANTAVLPRTTARVSSPAPPQAVPLPTRIPSPPSPDEPSGAGRGRRPNTATVVLLSGMLRRRPRRSGAPMNGIGIRHPIPHADYDQQAEDTPLSQNSDIDFDMPSVSQRSSNPLYFPGASQERRDVTLPLYTDFDTQPSSSGRRPTNYGNRGNSNVEADEESDDQDSSSQATGSQQTTGTDDIPPGVDPSFLEALPEEVRLEVIADQNRLARMRAQATTSTANSNDNSMSSIEVNPEFLAALPPALQEEVLAQQRLEQQRQAAASANPDDPVDAAAFFQNLQPSLRQAILTDIDETQMSVLPPDLAAEAQNLRRDWEARNRQLMQERFLNQLQSNTALSSILRQSGRGRLGGTRYAIHTVPQRWNTWTRDGGNASGSPVAGANVRMRGRQLLDHESLSCLLVLLFADEPKMNTLRLHKVFKYLCYHSATRDWIFKALLSIIERSVNIKIDLEISNSKANKRSRPGPLCAKLQTDPRSISNNAAWLNIKMDAALGCRANVFIVHRLQSGKKNDRLNTSSVTIHPQAAPTVCRHALDLLISLSKTFPTFFLPLTPSKDDENKDKEGELKKTMSPTKSKPESTDFWDILLKLDSLSATKKGKSVAKVHSNLNMSSESDSVLSSFETSAFGQLMSMLSSPVIRRSTQLTDKMLKLLSLITVALPHLSDDVLSGKIISKGKVIKTGYSALEETLKLVITAITKKNCSEEGLEDAATLLYNVANCNEETQYLVLWLMLDGSLDLGEEITSQINELLDELKSTNRVQKQTTAPSTSEDNTTDRPLKGFMNNRFTHEPVVISAAAKVKQTCDLQLPTMTPLTNKISSQAFFLRLLRLVALIHEGIRKGATDPPEPPEEAAAVQVNTYNNLYPQLPQLPLEEFALLRRGQSAEIQMGNVMLAERGNADIVAEEDENADVAGAGSLRSADNAREQEIEMAQGSFWSLRNPQPLWEAANEFPPLRRPFSEMERPQSPVAPPAPEARVNIEAGEGQSYNTRQADPRIRAMALRQQRRNIPRSPSSPTAFPAAPVARTPTLATSPSASTPNSRNTLPIDTSLPDFPSWLELHLSMNRSQARQQINQAQASLPAGPHTPQPEAVTDSSEGEPCPPLVTDSDSTVSINPAENAGTSGSHSSGAIRKTNLTTSAASAPDAQPQTSQSEPTDMDTNPPASTSGKQPSGPDVELEAEIELPVMSELLHLGKLWSTLSECLLELEHTPDHHAVLVLQPTVEAFFLVHSPIKSNGEGNEDDIIFADSAPESQESIEIPSMAGSSQNTEVISAQAKARMPPEQQKFLEFADKHRTVLNQILRQTNAHLADGPFSVLVDHTRILDFDVKRKYFRTELERLDNGIRREETAVHVRRSNVFEDSFRELYRRTSEEWKNRFYIVFEEEEGQDAGGLLREWYMIISRDIFNPMYALFTVSPGDRVTYMINSSSHCNPNHLCYYKFVGRVIAKAIYDNKLLECYFTRSFYKHILGIPIKYTDMESEDYSFYSGLRFLIHNKVTDLGYELTFSQEMNEFGTTNIRELLPNGRNVVVTDDNKMEYVRLLCQMKMTDAIKQQLKAFLEGFYDIIPKRLISIFNEQELELLISGLPNVDIEDLKSNTEYHKYQATSLQIQWFWRALRSFDQADRAKFLQFVTGTSKVPLQGFSALEGMNGTQKFQIHRDDRSTDRLPSAHTCFNQLDLPVYETYDKLRSYLLKAIHECSEGFGFA